MGLPLAINVFGSALLAVAFPAATVGLAFMVSREVYRVVVGRRRRALGGLVEAILEEATRAIADRALGEAEGPLELPRG